MPLFLFLLQSLARAAPTRPDWTGPANVNGNGDRDGNGKFFSVAREFSPPTPPVGLGEEQRDPSSRPGELAGNLRARDARREIQGPKLENNEPARVEDGGRLGGTRDSSCSHNSNNNNLFEAHIWLANSSMNGRPSGGRLTVNG